MRRGNAVPRAHGDAAAAEAPRRGEGARGGPLGARAGRVGDCALREEREEARSGGRAEGGGSRKRHEVERQHAEGGDRVYRGGGRARQERAPKRAAVEAWTRGVVSPALPSRPLEEWVVWHLSSCTLFIHTCLISRRNSGTIWGLCAEEGEAEADGEARGGAESGPRRVRFGVVRELFEGRAARKARGERTRLRKPRKRLLSAGDSDAHESPESVRGCDEHGCAHCGSAVAAARRRKHGQRRRHSERRRGERRGHRHVPHPFSHRSRAHRRSLRHRSRGERAREPPRAGHRQRPSHTLPPPLPLTPLLLLLQPLSLSSLLFLSVVAMRPSIVLRF
mmetsp:Transcript_15618/g.51277  ORF Transcript_15618/g.51277 Transcript_15618/m.51277 type:complete len:335 (+) Transcript_15618:210-1214(+)